MPERPEIHLIDAATRGDIESFGKLCQQYYAAMVAVAYAVLNDHQLAELIFFIRSGSSESWFILKAPLGGFFPALV